MNTNEQALVCDLIAIPAEVREEHVVSAPQLFAAAQEVQGLADGYAIRFSNETGRFISIARFIENERLCCPFFRFELEMEPNNGSIWLKLTGREGVKEILQSTLLECRGDMAELMKSIHTGDDPKLDALIANVPFPILANTTPKDSSG